jgi:hypothetical protein
MVSQSDASHKARGLTSGARSKAVTHWFGPRVEARLSLKLRTVHRIHSGLYVHGCAVDLPRLKIDGGQGVTTGPQMVAREVSLR